MKAAGVRRALVAIACAACGEASAQQDPAPWFAPTSTTRPYRIPCSRTLRRASSSDRRVRRLEPDDTRAGPSGVLQGAGPAAWPLLYRDERLIVNASLAATVGAFAFRNNQFAPAPAQVSPSFRDNPGWGELFVEPGVTARWRLYAIGLRLRGHRLHGDGDGRRRLRRYRQHMARRPRAAYAGARWEDKARGVQLDVSYGQQNLVLGQSFLIAAGASNGAQRGASFLGPRTAWANAAIARRRSATRSRRHSG